VYARCAQAIGDRGTLSEENLPALTEITADEDVSRAVLDAARTSMGMDISAHDLSNVELFTTRLVSLARYRISLGRYLGDKMHAVAPNLAALIGETVGARLISHAGSLTSLAKAPASTVQILGAEKALFRALKTKGNTPKYGLIFHSSFIGRAAAKNKGRISRYLANKCSIAARIDSFADKVTSKFGERMRDQVEDRLKFYESGEAPKRNVDVMAAVVAELAAESGGDAWAAGGAGAGGPSAKKAKKDKKGARTGRGSGGALVEGVAGRHTTTAAHTHWWCPLTSPNPRHSPAPSGPPPRRFLPTAQRRSPRGKPRRRTRGRRPRRRPPRGPSGDERSPQRRRRRLRRRRPPRRRRKRVRSSRRARREEGGVRSDDASWWADARAHAAPAPHHCRSPPVCPPPSASCGCSEERKEGQEVDEGAG
jgi:hypothetical protein